MIYNKIPAVFSGTSRIAIAEPVNYQYDVKQILVISGLELPEYYEVDFCNVGDTQTITMVGTADGVAIPDEFLATGERVKAYIVVQGEDDGAVETRYEVTIPVNKRPERTDIQPTPAEQQQIDTLVDILMQGASGNSDIYWATYGETTLAEMETAYQAGKQIMVKRLSYIFGLTQHWENYFSFSVISDNTEEAALFVHIKCNSNGWTYENYAVPFLGTVESIVQPTIVEIPDDGDVSVTLQPNTIYRFTGATTDIDLWFAEPQQGELPHYNFTVDVGQTAPTLTFNDAAIGLPDWYHGLEAHCYYEFDTIAREIEGIPQKVYFLAVAKW